MNWYIAVLKNYVGFSGRARRTEYWMYALINFIVYAVLLGLGVAVHGLLFLYYLYALATALPTLAVLFRRLHDTGRTAWWILISLVPLVGSIVLLVLVCLPGTPGANKYGSDPKAPAYAY